MKIEIKIPSGWIKEAQARWTALEHKPLPPFSAIGCDPAKGGKDRTVVSSKNGAIVNYHQSPGKQTPDGSAVAQIVSDLLEKWIAQKNSNKLILLDGNLNTDTREPRGNT